MNRSAVVLTMACTIPVTLAAQSPAADPWMLFMDLLRQEDAAHEKACARARPPLDLILIK